MADKWEVCLVNQVTSPPHKDSSRDAWYEAKVISPSGTMVITKSDTVSNAINYNGVFAPEMRAVLEDAYCSVVEQLLADGWEPLGRQFFRRRVHS